MPVPTAEELEEDPAIKREFIRAYFEDLDKKIAFLVKLSEDGHDDEARLLCLVYLDGLANWLHHPDRASGKNFSKALMKYGGNEELFSLILPKLIDEELPWRSTPKGLETDLKTAMAVLPPEQAFLPSEFIDRVRPHLAPAHIPWLESEIWRGSIANLVYISLRSPGVHYVGPGHGLSFSSTFWARRSLGSTSTTSTRHWSR